MPDLIYFDNNATTRPLDEVSAAMQACLRDEYANPSSVHRFGQRARFAVEKARAEVAELLAASPGEIVFTSGGTESINLALHGALAGLPADRPLVVSAADHRAVLATAKRLQHQGRQVSVVGVDENGVLRADGFESALARRPGLVSLTAANNETGVIWDIPALTRAAHAAGALVHVDAVQAVGRLNVDVRAWGADLVSVSAHKFHGPKGVGILYLREGTPLAPLLVGGAQERQRRGGTENTPGIIGMGIAARLATADGDAAVERIGGLRDRWERELCGRIPGVRVIAQDAARLCNTSCVAFEGTSAEKVLLALSEAGVCASSGSACSSGALEPSHVLRAMGFDDDCARAAVRFSLSRFTTVDEVNRVVSLLPALLARSTAAASPRM